MVKLRLQAAAVCAFCVLSFSAGLAHAQADGPLRFAKSYTITGNYIVGGVDVSPSSAVNGFVTATIPMKGVPANADILAAFLYWESISTNVSQVGGVKFR